MLRKSNMLNRHKSSEDESSSEPLNEEEQTQIVETLKKDAEAQDISNRLMFHYIFLIIAFVFGVCFILTVISPWTIHHQKHFQDRLPLWTFLAYYFGSMYCFVVSAFLVKNPLHSQLVINAKITGFFVAVLILLTWSGIFYVHGVSNPFLFWIPVVNMLGLFLAQYIDFDSSNLLTSVNSLETLKYSHKSA